MQNLTNKSLILIFCMTIIMKQNGFFNRIIFMKRCNSYFYFELLQCNQRYLKISSFLLSIWSRRIKMLLLVLHFQIQCSVTFHKVLDWNDVAITWESWYTWLAAGVEFCQNRTVWIRSEHGIWLEKTENSREWNNFFLKLLGKLSVRKCIANRNMCFGRGTLGN